MPQFERRLYDPSDDVRVFDGGDDDMEEEGSRLPLLIVIALVVLASFAGVVWLAYTQGVQRGRQDAPRIIAAQQAAPRAASGPQKSPYSDLNIYQPTKPDEEANEDSAPQPPTIIAPKLTNRAIAAPSPATKPPAAAATPTIGPAHPAATVAQKSAVPPATKTIAPATKPAMQTAKTVGAPVRLSPPATGAPRTITPATTALIKPTPQGAAAVPKPAPARPQTGSAATAPAPKPTTTVTQTAALNPAAAPPPTVQQPAPVAQGTSGFVLQIGSYKSEAEANASWQTYKGAHPSVAGFAPDVRQAELGPKGTWYRLRVGPFATLSEANAACAKLKAQGGSCFPAKR
jgi:cell division protein FtsN